VRVLAVVHQDDAGPGVFADAAGEAGWELSTWKPPEEAPPDGADAVVVLGGAMHVDHEEAHPWLRREKEWLGQRLAEGTPLLGVCLGAQLLAEVAGGRAERAPRPEIGWHDVELERSARDDPLLAPLPPRFPSFQWHSYRFDAPPDATVLARNSSSLQAALLRPRAWAIQFHAEVTRANALGWVDRYRADPDALAIDLDPEPLRAETAERIAAWNELGRGLFGRFLEEAAG
jgi:GMP synthase-like glutamine amidotransferase